MDAVPAVLLLYRPLTRSQEYDSVAVLLAVAFRVAHLVARAETDRQLTRRRAAERHRRLCPFLLHASHPLPSPVLRDIPRHWHPDRHCFFAQHRPAM